MAKRFLRLEFSNGTFTDIELTKIVVVDVPLTGVGLHLDKLPDGTYRLLMNKNLCDFEAEKLMNIRVIRED